MTISPEDLVFIDCEATGLARPSHPISIGLAWIDGRSSLRLVRPHASWSDIAWEAEATKIHGLTEDHVRKNGHDVVDVAEWLNSEIDGRIALSDAPQFDGYWLSFLFGAALVQPKIRLYNSDLSMLETLALRWGPNRSQAILQEIRNSTLKNYPHTHRADEDALSMAMTFRACLGLPGLRGAGHKG